MVQGHGDFIPRIFSSDRIPKRPLRFLAAIGSGNYNVPPAFDEDVSCSSGTSFMGGRRFTTKYPKISFQKYLNELNG
jgi:hypothetical protein